MKKLIILATCLAASSVALAQIQKTKTDDLVTQAPVITSIESPASAPTVLHSNEFLVVRASDIAKQTAAEEKVDKAKMAADMKVAKAKTVADTKSAKEKMEAERKVSKAKVEAERKVSKAKVEADKVTNKDAVLLH
jgi:hypothetical protein